MPLALHMCGCISFKPPPPLLTPSCLRPQKPSQTFLQYGFTLSMIAWKEKRYNCVVWLSALELKFYLIVGPLAFYTLVHTMPAYYGHNTKSLSWSLRFHLPCTTVPRLHEAVVVIPTLQKGRSYTVVSGYKPWARSA